MPALVLTLEGVVTTMAFRALRADCKVCGDTVPGGLLVGVRPVKVLRASAGSYRRWPLLTLAASHWARVSSPRQLRPNCSMRARWKRSTQNSGRLRLSAPRLGAASV